jgi:hypothetical protein
MQLKSQATSAMPTLAAEALQYQSRCGCDLALVRHYAHGGDQDNGGKQHDERQCICACGCRRKQCRSRYNGGGGDNGDAAALRVGSLCDEREFGSA